MTRPSLQSFGMGIAFGTVAAAGLLAQSPSHATILNAATGFVDFDMHQSGDVVHVFGKAHPAPYCRSSDGGRTWSTLEQSLGYFTVHDSAVDGDVAVVIGPSYLANGGPTVAASQDGGLTWSPSQEITSYSVPTLLNQQSFAIHVDGNHVIAVWSESADNSIWTMRSTDGGQTFPGSPQLLGAAPTVGSAVITSIQTVADGPEMHVFWLRRIGNDYFPLMQSTTDAGQTWLSAPRQISTQPHQGSFRIAGTADKLYVAYDNGLRYSDDDGLTWTISPLPQTDVILSMATTGNRALVIGYDQAAVGYDIVIQTSLDGGATWPTPFTLSTTLTDLFPTPHISGDDLYVDLAHGSTGAWSALLRSRDDGATWHIHQSDVNAFSPGERRNLHVRHASPSILQTQLHAYVGLGYTPVGTGTPGTAGVVPTLSLQGLPTLGATSQLAIEDAIGGSIGVLGVSNAPPSPIPHGGGQLWLQAPIIATTFLTNGATGIGGDGDGYYPLIVPNNPSLAGLSLTAQAAVVDLAANSNFSLTNAIEVWVR